MPHEVFISYSQMDKAVAEEICASLESAGMACWIAPRDVPPGKSWPAAIVEAIEQCQLMVLVFSGHSNNSTDVHNEVHLAVEEGKTILPFRLQDTKLAAELRYHLMRVHWLEAHQSPLQATIAKLTAYAAGLLGRREAGGAARGGAASGGAKIAPQGDEGRRRAGAAALAAEAAEAGRAASASAAYDELPAWDGSRAQAEALRPRMEAALHLSAAQANELGYFQVHGLGGPRKATAALALFAKAGGQVPEAAYNQAVMQLLGLGTLPDEPAAIATLQRLAKGNFRPAQLLLADCFEQAIGVLQNTKTAEQLRQAAARALATTEATAEAAGEEEGTQTGASEARPILAMHWVKKQKSGPFGKVFETQVLELAPMDAAADALGREQQAKAKAGAGAGAEMQFRVVLTGAGRNSIEVIRAIRENTKWSLSEAKQAVEHPPSEIRCFASAADARSLAAELESAGAQVEVIERRALNE